MSELYKLLQFADFGDERGKLVVIEGDNLSGVPFDIKRVFYIYGSDRTVVRGQHANRNSEFVLVNVAGSSKVMITDGEKKEIVELNQPMEAVYIPRMIWKEMYDFSPDSVLLVLANTHYDSHEYIRNYEEYLKEMGVLGGKKE
ncbi:MAG: FdtA/QdtA family cupin domain-containing protein [Spirochaetaceae bacterium]|nr:FdtA/QdtA family cupin domain-containing protein [Spirochaetaceae bacterium]